VKIAMNNSRDTIGINHRDQPSGSTIEK